MKRLWIFSLIAIAVPLAGCDLTEIPMIGMDDNRNAVEVFVKKTDYTKRFGTVVSSVEESVIPALEHRKMNTGFQLRTLVVGAGVNSEIGIGPFKVGAYPRFKVIFTNSSDPVLP